MPNANNPRGLVPLRDAGSKRETGGLEQFFVTAADANPLYIGDPVVKSGSADPSGAYATVTRAAATGAITGVVEGFVPDGKTDVAGFRAANTAGYVLVRTDPNTLFEIQANGALTANDIGSNAAMTVGAGGSFGRRSGFTLDAASLGTSTAASPLKIVGLAARPGNELGAFNKVWVKINNSTEANASAGV